MANVCGRRSFSLRGIAPGIQSLDPTEFLRRLVLVSTDPKKPPSIGTLIHGDPLIYEPLRLSTGPMSLWGLLTGPLPPIHEYSKQTLMSLIGHFHLYYIFEDVLTFWYRYHTQTWKAAKIWQLCGLFLWRPCLTVPWILKILKNSQILPPGNTPISHYLVQLVKDNDTVVTSTKERNTSTTGTSY